MPIVKDKTSSIYKVVSVVGDPDWEPKDWKNPDFDTSPKNPS